MNDSDQYPYSPLFQRRIMAALLQDPAIYSQFYGIWDSDHFEDSKLRIICQCWLDYRLESKNTPDKETIINQVVLRHDNSPDAFKKELVEEIEELYNHEVVDKEWTLKMVVEWTKNQAIERAVIQSAEELEKGRKERIRPIIDEAYRVGDEVNNRGIQVSREFKQKVSEIIQEEQLQRIPTGFTDLDLLLGGGIGGGELMVFLGPPKGFKSGNLLNCVFPCISAPIGKNATYVSLELKEEKVLERAAYRITRMNKHTLVDDSELFDRTFDDRVQQKMSGQFVIKNFPTRTMTATKLRAYLDMLESNGHKTDFLVVDYGNIMKPEDSFSSEWSQVASCFDALRAIAIERNIPVVSAARANREALYEKDLQMHHIAGSLEIAATVDYIVALVQTEEERRDWTMRHKLLLNRNEESGVVINCKIDYPTYFIQNTGIAESVEDEDDNKGSTTKETQETKRSSTSSGKGNFSGQQTRKSVDPKVLAELRSKMASKV